MVKFKITLDAHFFTTGAILITQTGCKLKVLEHPHKKWYKLLLQWVTFGWYKCPTEYKVEVIKD